MIGSPQVAETTSSTVSAGFGGSAGGGALIAGLAGSAGSFKRTHCVQAAEIDFSQPYDVVPYRSTRAWDWVAASAFALTGLIQIDATTEAVEDYRAYPWGERPDADL